MNQHLEDNVNDWYGGTTTGSVEEIRFLRSESRRLLALSREAAKAAQRLDTLQGLILEQASDAQQDTYRYADCKPADDRTPDTLEFTAYGTRWLDDPADIALPCFPPPRGKVAPTLKARSAQVLVWMRSNLRDQWGF